MKIIKQIAGTIGVFMGTFLGMYIAFAVITAVITAFSGIQYLPVMKELYKVATLFAFLTGFMFAAFYASSINLIYIHKYSDEETQ